MGKRLQRFMHPRQYALEQAAAELERTTTAALQQEHDRKAKIEQAALDREQAALLLTVTEADMITQFGKHSRRLKEATEAWTSEREHVMAGFRELRGQWFELPIAELSQEQAADMYRLYHQDLPEAIGTTCHEYVFAHSGYSESQRKALGKLSAMLTRVNKVLTSYNQRVGGPVAMVTTAAPADGFPRLFSVSQAVDARVSQVSQLWQVADGREHSHEDAFFLAQVAQRYLPDAWLLFNTFEYATVEVKAQAEQLLLEQLNFVEERLRAILSHNAEVSLSALRAHTTFMAKKAQPVVALGAELPTM